MADVYCEVCHRLLAQLDTNCPVELIEANLERHCKAAHPKDRVQAWDIQEAYNG